MCFVSFNISHELWPPILWTRLWHFSIDAIRMLMPKTAMNKDNGPVSWQCDVGLSRKVFSMNSKSITLPVK
jgi:hypothetical protein